MIYYLVLKILIVCLSLSDHYQRSAMKNFILSVLLMLATTTLFAQEATVDTLNATPLSATGNREIGLRMPSLNNFDLFYKKQKRENVYMRYRIAAGGISVTNITQNPGLNAGFALAVGPERRTQVAKKIDLITGTEFIAALNVGVDYRVSIAANVGVGFVLGGQYNVSDRVYLGIETIPQIMVSSSFSDDGIGDINASAMFNMYSAAVTAMFRFTK